jgi:hypothetical protein
LPCINDKISQENDRKTGVQGLFNNKSKHFSGKKFESKRNYPSFAMNLIFSYDFHPPHQRSSSSPKIGVGLLCVSYYKKAYLCGEPFFVLSVT